MTIFALCCFAEGLDPNPDAATAALRAAGYQVFRLPAALKATLEIKGDDFIEVRGEGDNDNEESRDAMKADVNRILHPFGGEIDPSYCVTIAELWTPSPDRCLHCEGLGTPDRPLLKIRIDENRAWLHRDCLRPGLDTLIEMEPIPF